MKGKIASLFLLLFLFSAPATFSQTDFGYQEEPEEKAVYLDYAYFREGAGENWRLEVYYKAFNSKLTFVKENEKFKASYEIEIILFQKNKQVTANSHEEEYTVDSYQETQSATGFLINQINLYAPAGEYKLSFKLIDHNSNQVEKSEVQISLPFLKPGEPVLSGLELARSLEEVKDSTKFVKRGKQIIPSVSRLFGDPEPFFWVYFELYGLSTAGKTEDYLLTYELESGDRTIAFRDTNRAAILSASDQTLYDFKRIELGLIPERVYTLHLKLSDRAGKVKVKAEKELRVEWSPLYQVKTDWDKAVDLLRYVASDAELKELEGAKEDERVKKWTEFWKSKNPNPDSPENELMEEYYKRVRYANEYFGIYDKEGYRTDMGMVYIKFGRPDEVDRHPFELGTKAYQVWYYYRIDCQFVFMDVTGYGEYELQYPYKCKI